MDTQHNMEERIWNFIDGSADARERSVVEELIAKDAAWKEKYKELLEVSDLLQSSAVEEPSMRFTKNVMEDIAKLHIAPATRSYINNKVIWGISFIFIALFISAILYAVSQGSAGGDEPSTISKNLDKFDFSKIFSNTWVNVAMMINVVLGLVILDYYLSRRKASSYER